MTEVVLQMRAALAKEAAPGFRMGDFGQVAGGMVDPGRGPRQTNVLLKNVLDTTWYLATAKIVYRMERFRQSIGRCYLEFLWVLL